MIRRVLNNQRFAKAVVTCAVGSLVVAMGWRSESHPSLALVESVENSTQTNAGKAFTDEEYYSDSVEAIVSQADSVRPGQTIQTRQPIVASKQTEESVQAINVNLATAKHETSKKESGKKEKTAGEATEQTANDNPPIPHKNKTTLLLASFPDIRARRLLQFVRGQLPPVQEEQALELLLRNDYQFQRLIKERENVLNVASDGDETADKLRQIRMETLEVSNRLRLLVYAGILTAEQKQARNEVVRQAQLDKQLEAEKRRR